jgi:hypothetical protein
VPVGKDYEIMVKICRIADEFRDDNYRQPSLHLTKVKRALSAGGRLPKLKGAAKTAEKGLRKVQKFAQEHRVASPEELIFG